MNRADRRAAERQKRRCKHERTMVKDVETRKTIDGDVVQIGYRYCLDCGDMNKYPVRVPYKSEHGNVSAVGGTVDPAVEGTRT